MPFVFSSFSGGAGRGQGVFFLFSLIGRSSLSRNGRGMYVCKGERGGRARLLGFGFGLAWLFFFFLSRSVVSSHGRGGEGGRVRSATMDEFCHATNTNNQTTVAFVARTNNE